MREVARSISEVTERAYSHTLFPSQLSHRFRGALPPAIICSFIILSITEHTPSKFLSISPFVKRITFS